MSAQDVIDRCTRDGVTSWQSVAKQLGISIDRARRLYDPVSSARRDPQQLGQPELEPVDENDLSSPYPKGEGMKAKILALLERQSMSAEMLAGFLLSPVNSVRARLDRMLEVGQVCHDGAYPRTWGLMESDGTPRQYTKQTVGTVYGSLAGQQRMTERMAVTSIVLGGRIGGSGNSRWSS